MTIKPTLKLLPKGCDLLKKKTLELINDNAVIPMPDDMEL